MTDRIRKLFILRKQSDTVKLMFLFAVAGIGFLCQIVRHVWGIYDYVNAPAEYVLTADRAVTKAHVDELRQMHGVTGVSPQAEISVIAMYRGTETPLSCTALSQDYMEDMFDTELSAATKRFYMNEAAFSEWKALLSDSDINVPEPGRAEQAHGSTEIGIRYCLPETSPKSAKLIVTQTGEEEGIICTADSDGSLLREACSLRVRFGTHDLDGIRLDRLGNMGYEIENKQVVLAEEYEVKERLLHIRYSLFCCAICLVSALSLRSRKARFVD